MLISKVDRAPLTRDSSSLSLLLLSFRISIHVLKEASLVE